MVKKERWASRLGLVLAMAGNAVGLGNFLRFPAQAAKHGGGAFLIPYFVALLVLGLPLIWIEWTMGRFGGKYGHHSTPGIFQSMAKHPVWKYLGVFGLWVNLIIAAYYLYIESWTIAYAGYSLWGGFSTTDPNTFFAAMTGEAPNQILSFSWWGIAIFGLCLVINVVILSRGLAKGIELVSKIGMPLLIVFAMLLAVRGLMIVPGTAEEAASNVFVDVEAKNSPFDGLNFVWQPKYDKLSSPAVWLAAAGQIFFTLAIGMGSIHCYASYLRETDDITLTGATAAWTNEFCEVVLGSAILIPIAVAYLGLNEVTEMTSGGSGFDMGFKVFPKLFRNWGALAPAAGFLWFGLLFFAAITSSLAMGQPIMAFLQTEFKFTRAGSAWAFGAMLIPLAIPVAMLNRKSFFDEFDYWASTFSLVLFAVIETILFSWIFGAQRGWNEMSKGAELAVPRFFFYIMKYVTPVFLLLILTAYTFMPEGRMVKIDKESRQEVRDETTGELIYESQGWEPYLKTLFTNQPVPKWEWSADGMVGQILFKDIATKRAALEEKIQAGDNSVSAELSFTNHLMTWRIVDRLVMIVTFGFFCVLVRIAWQRRRAEGRE